MDRAHLAFNKHLDAFDAELSTHCMEVTGRILPPPEIVYSKVSQFFTFQHSTTHGNSLKLFKNRTSYDCAKYFFSNRVVEVWNLLSDLIVLQPSLQSFRSSLERFDLSRLLRGRGLDV